MIGSVVASAQEMLTPELLWKIGRVNLEDVSPDGKMAAYSVTRYDMAENKSAKTLYLVQIATGATTALTDSRLKSGDAQFTPDGQRVGFLRDGLLYEVNTDGKNERKLSDISMNGFKYAPDGRHIAFVQDVKLDNAPSDNYPDLTKTSGRVSEGLFYRHWDSWHDYAYSHVFLINYQHGTLSGEAKDLMPGEKYDAPLSPMGGMEQINFSPDGKQLAYTCRKLNGTAEAKSTNADIYVYDLATGVTTNRSEGMPGYDQEPFFSPDGHYMAWTSMEEAQNESDRTRLMVLDLRTGKREEWTKGWKWECNNPQWSPDGKYIYFLSSQDFTYQLYRMEAGGRNIKALTSGRHDYHAFKVAGSELVSARTALDAPAEIYAVSTADGKARALTQVTGEVWDNLKKVNVQRRQVRTTDGKDMNVWVVLPPDFDTKKKYPALLYCQGGPQSALSQFFSYRWNLSLMASQGYVVVAPCRRGMPGGPEGQDWNAAISGDWGRAGHAGPPLRY